MLKEGKSQAAVLAVTLITSVTSWPPNLSEPWHLQLLCESVFLTGSLWGRAALLCVERARECLSRRRCLMDTGPLPVPAMKATVWVTIAQGLGWKYSVISPDSTLALHRREDQSSDRDGDLSQVTEQGNGTDGTRFCFFYDSRLMTTSPHSSNQIDFNVSTMEKNESSNNMLLGGLRKTVTFWPRTKCPEHTLLLIKDIPLTRACPVLTTASGGMISFNHHYSPLMKSLLASSAPHGRRSWVTERSYSSVSAEWGQGSEQAGPVTRSMIARPHGFSPGCMDCSCCVCESEPTHCWRTQW